jgi:regulatory LuxR family protein
VQDRIQLAVGSRFPVTPAFEAQHERPRLEKGLSNKEIAAQLSIAVTMVKNHEQSILDKLKVHHRGEAASLLRASGPAGF